MSQWDVLQKSSIHYHKSTLYKIFISHITRFIYFVSVNLGHCSPNVMNINPLRQAGDGNLLHEPPLCGRCEYFPERQTHRLRPGSLWYRLIGPTTQRVHSNASIETRPLSRVRRHTFPWQRPGSFSKYFRPSHARETVRLLVKIWDLFMNVLSSRLPTAQPSSAPPVTCF